MGGTGNRIGGYWGQDGGVLGQDWGLRMGAWQLGYYKVAGRLFQEIINIKRCFGELCILLGK